MDGFAAGLPLTPRSLLQAVANKDANGRTVLAVGVGKNTRNGASRHAYTPYLSRAILTASLMMCSAEVFAESRIIGLGNQTCATWTANPSATSEVGQLYQQWAPGFLSGVSFADANHDPLSNQDAAIVTSWLDYRRDDATAHFPDAAIAFVRAHQPAKN
jgi:hypothetical protein